MCVFYDDKMSTMFSLNAFIILLIIKKQDVYEDDEDMMGVVLIN